MPYLYQAKDGYKISKHSYSASQMWSCKRRYKLRKIDGWQPKEERSALEFGNCVEAAVQYYHLHGRQPGSGSEEFSLLWWGKKDSPEITFSEKSGDFDCHMRMGRELLKLYESVLPTLPIDNEQFQVKYDIEFWPESELKGLGYTARIDLLSQVDWNHPALPHLEGEGKRSVIIDLKTSSKEYYQDPRLSALDPQLRDYAWATNVPTVAFLVFVKNSTSFGTGDWVRPLSGDKANKNYVILDLDDTRAILVTGKDYDEFQERKKQVTGKGKKDAVDALLTEYVYRGFRISPSEITKQKIQFLPAVIPYQDMEEARLVKEKETLEIYDCARNDFFPKNPGIRWPKSHCIDCECLGICIGDQELISEKLVQIGGAF